MRLGRRATRVAVVVVAAAAVMAMSGLAQAFYMPTMSPVAYGAGDRVPMWVNKVNSLKTQLPYRYYDLPYCVPEVLEEGALNLGQIIAGEAVESSLYELYAGKNTKCQVLCHTSLDQAQVGKFVEFIDNEYTAHWILDNLPAAVRLYNLDNPQESVLERGFPIGFVDPADNAHYLYNHIRFDISYNTNEEPDGRMRIVGFEVEPFSVRHEFEGPSSAPTVLTTCNTAVEVNRDLPKQRIDEATSILFTYDVNWRVSEVQWAHRWDVFFNNASSDDSVHWFSVINSTLVVFLLTGMIAMILIRALNKDIARYNEPVTADDDREETGWKMVHGDVFRPPAGFFGPILLSASVGTGCQILSTAFAVIILGVLGFLSPANRGGVMTTVLVLYMFMGSFSGYYGARLYKMFRGKAWKRTTVITAIMFPLLALGSGFILNFFVWSTGSSSAIPFTTMLAICALWMCVSTPLVCLGAFFGYKKEEVQHPCGVKAVASYVPPQPWYLSDIASVLIGGILPFGAVFVEVYFVMSSVWLQQVYVVFGFLLLSLVLLVLTCAEISVVMCYFQLCAENYNWWWRSFLTSGSSALYLFAYSVLYFTSELNVTAWISVLMYFGYMSIVAMTFFFLTGCVGFVSCLLFVRAIYGAIKVD